MIREKKKHQKTQTNASKILIDIYKTNNLNAGLGQFSFNFACELIKHNSLPFDITFLYQKKNNIPSPLSNTIKFKKVNFINRYFPQFTTTYSLWHSTYQFPSFLPNNKTKHLLTIHDLNFLTEKNKKKSQYYLKKLQHNINNASAITVISEFTKKQVIEHLTIGNKKIYTIHNGIILQEFNNLPKPYYVTTDDFFFTIGILTPKKNFHILIPLMKHFPKTQLIIAGNKNTKYAHELYRTIEKNNLQKQVILTGTITEAEKYWLYKHCKAFLFPSLAEGFGMPPIEAMLLGKPVFLSQYASLPEIGGTSAFYFNSFNEFEMVETINKNLDEYYKNENTHKTKIQQHAKKFSWSNAIKNYIAVYSELLQ